MQDKGLKTKIKICYVITKGNWGGAQKYVYNLATSLPKDLYETVVIIGEGEALEERLNKAGIRTRKLQNLQRDISITREIKSFFELFKIIKSESPDILHLNSPKAGGLGALAGRLLFIHKIIFTAHGWTFNEERKVRDNFFITLLSWVTIILCHKTIVLGKYEEKQARIMPLVRNNKIILIRNGVEKILFDEKTSSRKVLSARTGTSEVPNILWIGTISELHKNKGLEYAILAVSKIYVPFAFFIIGEGEERKKLEELIVKNGLESKVFLLGFLDRASQYLKAFDIFLLTSTKEGLPYALLEAGQASLPVIASYVGGIPDIIENSVSGILTTKARAGEITRAIEYLINNPDKQKTFGNNLKEKIEKEFSISQMLEKTIELYS